MRYHYLETGPPPAEWLQDSRAVLTWFYDEHEAPPWLWPLLESAVDRHAMRVVHLGDLGPLKRDPERLARWLKRFGLKSQDLYLRDALRVAVEFRDEKLCAYEANPRPHAVHTGPRSVDPKNRVWVTTRDRFDKDAACHPIVTGRWGALALDPWFLLDKSEQGERRWFVDPFAFFREALGMERVPAPHPAVLNGRRMWFCQVDGDGFESYSSVEPGKICGHVFTERVLKAYPLPFTVSVIVSSLTDDYEIADETEKMALARRTLQLPNVEPASHGVLHTLNWRRPLRPDSKPRTIVWYPSLKNFAYTPVAEVRESIRFVNERLLDAPRRCEVMLWTGEANPDEAAIRAATEAGCVNLNGGVFRWDAWHDSLAFVTPWSRRVGRQLQVYAGAANENAFEGFFDTMPGAFAHIDATIRRTGEPRILKPANLYVHFYSAENPQRLRALGGPTRALAGQAHRAGPRQHVRARRALRGARSASAPHGTRLAVPGLRRLPHRAHRRRAARGRPAREPGTDRLPARRAPAVDPSRRRRRRDRVGRRSQAPPPRRAGELHARERRVRRARRGADRRGRPAARRGLRRLRAGRRRHRPWSTARRAALARTRAAG